MEQADFIPNCNCQPADSAGHSSSVRALQQDLDELKSINSSLRKENRTLREQLGAARNGTEEPRHTAASALCSLERMLNPRPS